eukprot:gnl/TRDRNA2_/TRDRNA2_83473_c1_seq1.p1 gnl/TRDRNA2_/TRDRNA2_83473_c1~~gnl/TRDRNA2_/TRDRNA2_83473_c1_seq1.p1  ORF type:complete len:371 (-),score=52.57 gnl/TRDRNA2_/TRDRNA2_83473_c1_seq1:83-1066(-)
MAPEVIAFDFSYKCDIWSLGCMLFAIFNTKPMQTFDQSGRKVHYLYPFVPLPTSTDPNGLRGLRKFQRKGPPMSRIAEASTEAQKVVRCMLTFDESKRPSAEACLAMPWFNMIGTEREVQMTHQQVATLLGNRDGCSTLWWDIMSMDAAVNLPASTTAGLEALFNSIDTDHNGCISEQEFLQCAGKMSVSPEQAHKVKEAVDIDKSGCIEWSEFVAAMLPCHRELFAAAVQTAFDDFDLNHDEYLDRDEVMEILRRMHGNLPQTLEGPSDFVERTVDMMMEEVDADGDGKISMEEFRMYFGKSGVLSPAASMTAELMSLTAPFLGSL